MARNVNTYRAIRRNHFFGRKSRGNTSPDERRKIWELLNIQHQTRQQRLLDEAELKKAPL